MKKKRNGANIGFDLAFRLETKNTSFNYSDKVTRLPASKKGLARPRIDILELREHHSCQMKHTSIPVRVKIAGLASDSKSVLFETVMG